MAQSSLMYYAYFRFYVNESEIITGMEKFCTGWEHMFAVGYNYHEYKCFVDNLGGFEHWVGDMRGYISQTREVGFMDGAPSDAIYDTSLLMGTVKINEDDILTLNGVKRGASIYIRKLTAQDAGIAHKVKLTCGTAIINHPCMYTIDSNQIEILKPDADIVDLSDVDGYDYTADIGVGWLIGGKEVSITNGSVANFANMVDLNRETYGRITTNGNCSLIIDMEADFTAIALLFSLTKAASYSGWITIYVSPDGVAWTAVEPESTQSEFTLKTIASNNVVGRYIKIYIRESSGNTVYGDIFRIFTS